MLDTAFKEQLRQILPDWKLTMYSTLQYILSMRAAMN